MKGKMIRLTAAAAAMMIAAGAFAFPAAASERKDYHGEAAAVSAARSDKELYSQSMNSQYLLPDSDTYYITEADISWMDDEELLLARNEFYARRGRKFVIKSIREYFEQQGWYQGTIEPDDFSPDLFNRYEQANVDFIVAYEKKRQEQREQKKKQQQKQKKENVTIETFGSSSEGYEGYSEIMELYVDSIREDWSDDDMDMYGVNELTGLMETPGNAGYLFRDLDGDGVDEMLIGATNPQTFGAGAVFEIYTMDEDTPVETACSELNSMFYVCGNNTIRRETILDDGRWEIDYFDYSDGELVYRNVLIMDESKNAEEPWYVIDKDADVWADADYSLSGTDWIPDSALKHISGKTASKLRASYASEELVFTPME